jgi:hypothetical protein
VVAGLVLIARGEGGLYWLAPGMLCCYLIAIEESRILLIEINR